jgi:hypothetical protein
VTRLRQIMLEELRRRNTPSPPSRFISTRLSNSVGTAASFKSASRKWLLISSKPVSGPRGSAEGLKAARFVWLNAYLLAPFRKMRFMARYTLPALIAIDKNIRKAILHREFSVITPYHGQPTDIREIAIDVCMQVRQFDCGGNLALICGTRQHCGAVDQ